jgi:FkbM family methyltransferase
MLLDIKELVNKYNLKIKGVIIIGAFYGLQEERVFSELGVKNLAFFEPSEFSYPVLRNNFTGKYPIYQVALGNENKKVILHSEKDNGGMSSSILNPKKHLEYYPYIHFPKELDFEVEMKRLDEYSFGPEYNTLDIDVQGFELEVLKGGVETLKHIDYVYIEVNREELYEGCPMVEDIDRFLSDFVRVETHWVVQGFGDSLYVRRSLCL